MAANRLVHTTIAALAAGAIVAVSPAQSARTTMTGAGATLLLYENADRRRSRLMVDFVRWALSDGQAMAPDLGYAPLPPAIVSLAREALGKIKT